VLGAFPLAFAGGVAAFGFFVADDVPAARAGALAAAFGVGDFAEEAFVVAGFTASALVAAALVAAALVEDEDFVGVPVPREAAFGGAADGFAATFVAAAVGAAGLAFTGLAAACFAAAGAIAFAFAFEAGVSAAFAAEVRVRVVVLVATWLLPPLADQRGRWIDRLLELLPFEMQHLELPFEIVDVRGVGLPRADADE
jgi:hypothetical protein